MKDKTKKNTKNKPQKWNKKQTNNNKKLYNKQKHRKKKWGGGGGGGGRGYMVIGIVVLNQIKMLLEKIDSLSSSHWVNI